MTDILKQFVATANARADANTFKAGAKAMAEDFDRRMSAMRELVEACELDFGVPDENDEDDEPVGGGLDGEGKPDHMAVTFGMIRRARAALNPLREIERPMYELKGGEEIIGGKLYGWTGQKCEPCKGQGERYSRDADHDRPCPDCGGTGEQWGRMPMQPDNL